MKQTAATFLVKAPSLNPSPDSIRLTSGISISSPPISGFQSFSPSLPLGSRSPVNLQQQCSSNRHKGSCSSSSSGGGSSRRQQQQIKHFYNGGISSSSLAAAWCISSATLVSACLCNRYLRSPGSAPTSHAAMIDLCPLPFRCVTTDIVSSDGSSSVRAIWFMYIRPPGNMQNQFTILKSIYIHCSMFFKKLKKNQIFLCNFPNSQQSRF